jgi:hypothetical protein
MMSQPMTTRHLHRLACLYVRQSTLQEVFENTESTARQYALRERAVALGWPTEWIIVIDQDLGHSGASPAWCGAPATGIVYWKSALSPGRSCSMKMASMTLPPSTIASSWASKVP